MEKHQMDGTEDIEGLLSFRSEGVQKGVTRCVQRVWEKGKSFIWDCKNKCGRLYEEKLRLLLEDVCAKWLHRPGITRCVQKACEKGKSFIQACKNRCRRLCGENLRLPSADACVHWLLSKVFRIISRKWLVLCLLTVIIFCGIFYGLCSGIPKEVCLPKTADMVTIPHGYEGRNIGKPELRIVLMGEAGTGKNSIRNSILGEKKVTSNLIEKSVTKACSKQKVKRNGRDIVLVDTPGLFDTYLPTKSVVKKIGRCVAISSPGPHAILLVLRPGRYTEEERKMVETLFDIFGEQIMKYMIVVFTHSNDLDNKNSTIENYVRNYEGKHLWELIEMCGNRSYTFNNTASNEYKEKQVSELIAKINRMVEENNAAYYCNEIYIRAEALFKKIEKLEKEKQEQQKNIQKIQEESKAKEDKLMNEIMRLKQEKVAIEKQLNQVTKSIMWNVMSSTRETWTWLDKIRVVWLVSCLLFFLVSDTGF